jgi:hypothetical protein
MRVEDGDCILQSLLLPLAFKETPVSAPHRDAALAAPKASGIFFKPTLCSHYHRERINSPQCL